MAPHNKPNESPLERGLWVLAGEIRTRHRARIRTLWLDVVRGEVLIRGVATCYYGKQLALDEVRRRCHLPVAANRIEVVDVEQDSVSRSLLTAEAGRR